MSSTTAMAHLAARSVLVLFFVLPGCGGGGPGSDTEMDDDADADTVDAGDSTDVPDTGDVAPDGPDDVTDASDDSQSDPDNTCIVPDAQEDTEDDPLLDVDPPDAGDVEDGMDATPDLVLDAGDVVSDPMDASTDVAPDAEDDGLDAPDVGAFECGGPLLDVRDGRSYATVLIGTQCWMAENLNVGTMVPGATNQTDDGSIQKHCYGDDTVNCDTHGGLYQWDELMGYTPSDAGNPSTTRGICPAGWHVPSDEEFKVLEIYLGMTSTEADMINAWRGAGVGTSIVVGGTSGYEALLSGRNAGGTFSLVGEYEYSYTSTDFGTNAWRRCLSGTTDTVGRWNTFPKTWSLSLRCVLF